MAKENETNSVIHAEQRVARLLVKRTGLKPPVNIDQLARKYAVVEQDVLPRDSDAVMFRRPGARPVIVLNQQKPATRKRFTLAHELGHILIPWHVGTVACHTDLVLEFDDRTYGQTEAEANRFASELLMPRSWLREQVRARKGLKSAFSAVRRTGVSPHAVSLALVQVLDPGYVFAVVDDAGKVSISGASEGTLATRPVRGHSLDRDGYDQFSSRRAKIEGVDWWYFSARSPLPVPKDPRNSGLILHDILRVLAIRGAQAEKLTQSISGIVGAANSAIHPESASELFAALRQRFASRPDLQRVTSHQDFDPFLARRAEEILGRRDATVSSTRRRKRE